jgi:thiamine-monophosphate kinase
VRELELIDQLERVLAPGDGRARPRGGRVLRGTGDDAAVVRAGGYAVTSVDAMVQDVHFRRHQLSPRDIGHRALAGALSDLAAMGAPPGEAYLVLGLPPGTPAEEALELVRGAQALADATGTVIAGGDVTAMAVLMVSFTVIGWTEEPGELVGRDGARPGDWVAVTGSLGGAGAGLALLDGRAQVGDQAIAAALRERYARPWPRLAQGRVLAAAGATAMIDLSDGLATDAAHLARRSRVALELSLEALPLHAGVVAVAEQLETGPAHLAATAGEDYELCVCLPSAVRSARELPGWRAEWGELTRIGQVEAGAPSVSFGGKSPALGGYEHRI